jgi:TPR repeat protein
MEGIGVRKDLEEALRYLKMGAEEGDTNAVANYAYCFLIANMDRAAKKDKSQAVKVIRQAAGLGAPHALLRYGMCLEKGIVLVVRKNVKESKPKPAHSRCPQQNKT